jgi:hypothetical protein
VICPKADDSHDTGLRRTDPCGAQIQAGINGVISCYPVNDLLSHLLSRICISIPFTMLPNGSYKINNVAFSAQYVDMASNGTTVTGYHEDDTVDGEDHRTVRMYH